MFFRKKSFVRFVNLVPGVEETHPIIPANKFKYKWLSELNRANIQTNQNFPLHIKKGNTARCPGILDICSRGYIVTAPFDFTITTNGDLNNFEWHMNINPSVFNSEIVRPYISAHSSDQLHDFSPPREDSLNCVVKVNTFWLMSSSKDVVWLQMPIPYPDHNMFTAYQGIIDTDKYCELILQIQWHKLNGQYLVKAGTPLCQLIPISKKTDTKLIVERANHEDLYKSKAYGYLTMHRFQNDMLEWREKAKKILKIK